MEINHFERDEFALFYWTSICNHHCCNWKGTNVNSLQILVPAIVKKFPWLKITGEKTESYSCNYDLAFSADSSLIPFAGG